MIEIVSVFCHISDDRTSFSYHINFTKCAFCKSFEFCNLCFSPDEFRREKQFKSLKSYETF